MIALRIVYLLNVLVAGTIAISCLVDPRKAAINVFSGAYEHTEVMRLVGCLWLAIAVLSAFGLWRPISFSPVLLLQFIYKGTWLVLVALPAIRGELDYPRPMAGFFLVWVVVLPFVIPWSAWLSSSS